MRSPGNDGFPRNRFLVERKPFPFITEGGRGVRHGDDPAAAGTGEGADEGGGAGEGASTSASTSASATTGAVASAFNDQQASAVFVAAYSREPLRHLLRRLDIWLALVLLGAGTGTFILARWTASRVSRPLEELARKTLRAELGRPGVDFASTRTDELGDLSRFLAAMMKRLARSARERRDAERRATLGDLARQVNHDMKNGLTPIRNVFRHLAQVAGENPQDLGTVFAERRPVLDTSLGYLESLAGNVAKLYRPGVRERCDLNAVAAQVAASRDEPLVTVRVTGGGAPPVLADPLALYRIVENLVANAVDSVAATGGEVTVEAGESSGGARLVVSDTGPGLSPEERKRIFDDFYTTKEGGAGLGLSIVRRMVSDCEGTVRVESEPGRGARFIVEFPAAGAGRGLGGEHGGASEPARSSGGDT
jgi:signal transduction histidine kinase